MNNSILKNNVRVKVDAIDIKKMNIGFDMILNDCRNIEKEIVKINNKHYMEVIPSPKPKY